MKLLRPALALALAAIGLLTATAQVPTWPKTTPADVAAAGIDVQVNGADFGNNTFVLSASFGGSLAVPAITPAVFTSPDGTTWTRRTLPVTGANVGAPRFLNGKFYLGMDAATNNLGVPTGTNGAVLSSTDGVTWSAVTLSVPLYGPRDFAFGNGVYVGLAGSVRDNSTQVIVSSDGATWNTRTIATGLSARHIAFFNGKFYASGDGFNGTTNVGGLYSSTDGSTWARINTAPAGTGVLAASGTKLLVTTTNGTTSGQAVSSDGVNFTTSTPGIDAIGDSIRYLNGAFLTVAATSSANSDLTLARASTDGLTWTTLGTTANQYDAREVAFGNGNYVFVGEFDVFTSGSGGGGGSTPAPTISTQPAASQSIALGGSVSFTVAAAGTGLSFQWYFNNVAISGAVSATYTINVTASNNAGNYTVVITNAGGSITSAIAALTINTAPVITVQPGDQTTILGGSVTFTATASGSPTPTLQWRKNGVAISGATGTTLTLTNVQAGDATTYTVVATNSAGSTTSNAAKLILAVIPAGFDVSAYLARYPDVAALFGPDQYGAWLYYRNHGIYAGEVFDDLFRVEEYLALYPELAALFGHDWGAALDHWLSTGRLEGKLGRIPVEFSPAGYFTRNPDVATAVGNDSILAWGHYWLYGIYEGRAYDDELRVFEYLAINADLTTAFVNDWRTAALHWMRYGRTEGRLGRIPLIFNVTEYLTRYPAVQASWGTYPTTVFLHYWAYGIDEGKNFDDLFRVDDYLALNPDLAAIFGTDRRGAFKHWVRYGQAEGRKGKNP